MSKFNYLLDESVTGNVNLNKVENRWAAVKDAVDYPVWVLPAFYVDPTQTIKSFINASGLTNTGREKQYCLVVVDKLRDGNQEVIATVTDTYGSLASKDVYEQLHQELVVIEQSHDVKRLYVSANGGVQQLTIKLNNMMSMNGIPDELSMMIRLNTSVDGPNAQPLSLLVHNKTGDTDIHTYGGDYTLSARHTKTIGERSAYYIPTIQKMIENWNEVVVPTMSLMYDCKFNRNVALELISGICSDSKMGERHTKNVTELYTSIGLNTNASDDSLYRINIAMNQYIDENLADMHDTKQKFKDSATKSIQKHLNKLKK